MADRRRVRAAHALLARVQQQRARFATAYSTARSPQQRVAATGHALLAAAAERHHRGNTETTARLDELTGLLTGLLRELHDESERHANHTLRAEARRIARNNGRNQHEHTGQAAA